MANAENRPFSGTWTYNNKKSRRHVPDCIVTFNGETAMPSCTGCMGQIDLQDLITSVSVSNSTDTSPSSVSLGMELPTNRRSCFFRDNKFILHPGIEIHVYMRGYFTHTELGGQTEDDNYNLNNATMKPYYQVFNGVITEVSHGFSGGFYSVSMSASDFLHFWQYQSINTNPSAFGSKADGNKTNINFTGHSYTRKNPFSVVHELFSSGHGDAGGHEWVLSDFANIGIKSDLFQASFWEVTGYYWQQRFQQPMGKLKMYGTDGRLFNSFEQFLLSSDLIGTGEANRSSDSWAALENKNTDDKRLGGIDNYMDSLLTVLRHSSSKDGEVTKQQYAFPSSSLFYVENTTWGVDTAKDTGSRGYNVAGVTAFALDINSLGQVNLFESQMQTKMDIASQVSLEIGFEFFIDFNGDYVFKPPFYNLDTSDSRVYVVKDIDLISFNSSEKEAECTVMKGTGGYFSNMASLFGKEFENRGMFVDWKGVAKYGWREASFETTFLNDPKSIYYAAMNRMALANKDVQSGDCSIPLRPEMKLGFPVYIEPFDVFYYVTGISHTFGYGSDCTTSLTLTAKRAKFFPPMNKMERFPKIEEVDFKNIYRPNHALFTRNGVGQPKYMGFPCVVLASDPHEINPLWFGLGEITNFLVNLTNNTTGESVGGNNYEGILTLVRAMNEVDKRVRYELLGGASKNNKICVKNAEGTDLKFTFFTLAEAAGQLRTDIDNRIDAKEWTQYEKNDAFVSDSFKDVITGYHTNDGTALLIFFKILDEVREKQGKFIKAGTNMENYLASLKFMKSNFRPDDQQPGMYRYYSSAFPNDLSNSATFQGMGDRQQVNVASYNQDSMVVQEVLLPHEIPSPKRTVKVIDLHDGTYDIVNPNADDQAEKVARAGGDSVFITKYGLPIRSFVYKDESAGDTVNAFTYNVMATEDIKKICFAVQFIGRRQQISFKINASIKFDKNKKNFSLALPRYQNDPFPDGISVGEVYDPFIDNHIEAIKVLVKNVKSTLASNNQQVRSESFQKFLDGLVPKYDKIKTRYNHRTYSRRRKGYFQGAYKKIRKAMESDLHEAVKFVNIAETLAISDQLSPYFNSESTSFEVSAKIPSGTNYYSGESVPSETVIGEDLKLLDGVSDKVIQMVSILRTTTDTRKPQDSYEYGFLSSWDGHPLYNGATDTRKTELQERLQENSASYFQESMVKTPQNGNYTFRAPKEEPYYSPVFPVSDEKGFEHFGTYAYGRGMTLKSLAQIIDTAPELWGDLSPLDLNRLYGAVAEGKNRKLLSVKEAESGSSLQSSYQAFDNNYRTTLNESIANYITTRGEEEVLSQDIITAMTTAGVDFSSTDSVFQHLKTWTTTGQEEVVGGAAGINIASKIFEQAFVGNIITTNQQYGQKIAAGNVPIELARLDQFYSPTTCNGGAANALSTSDAFSLESDQYSFAYNSNTGDFNETAWQQMLAENRLIDWFSHQEALRGEIQEPTITIQDFQDDANAIGEAFSTLSSDIQQTPDVFGQIVLGKSPENTQSTSLPPPTINEEDE